MPLPRTTAGNRSHLVRIQAPAGVLAADAVTVETRVPAAITVLPVPFQRSEEIVAGGLHGQTIYTVNVNYRTDVRPDYTLEELCCTMRRFQILAIVPGDRRDSVELRCVTAG